MGDAPGESPGLGCADTPDPMSGPRPERALDAPVDSSALSGHGEKGIDMSTQTRKIIADLMAVELDMSRPPDCRRLHAQQRQKVMAVTQNVTRTRAEAERAHSTVEALVRQRMPNNAPMSIQEARARSVIAKADEVDGDIEKVIAESRSLLEAWS
jgi:hypothetical protein